MSEQSHARQVIFAERALAQYVSTAGVGIGQDSRTSIQDMLTDFHHYCDAHDIDWYAVVGDAETSYLMETGVDGGLI